MLNQQQRKKLKKKILQNFLKLIESKPELLNNNDLRHAYTDLKKQIAKNEK